MISYINGSDEGVLLVKCGNEYVVPYHEFIVAKAAHIKNLPVMDSISVGSAAFCIETNQYLMFDGERWVTLGA